MATKPGGNQPFEHKPTLKTRAQVIDFACCGFTHENIAMYLDIDSETLRKHYRKELDKSMMMRTHKLSRNLYLDALAGDKGSREFWLKTRARWSYAKPEEDKEKDDKMISLLEAIVGANKK